MITEAQEKKYVAEGGLRCPKCRKENIEGRSVEIDQHYALQDMYCHDCEASWIDEYRLVSITEAELA